MRQSMALGVLGLLVAGLLGCRAGGPTAPVEPGDAPVRAGDVRLSLPTPHRVVAQRRTADGWGDARVVFEDGGRECGRVHAIAAGSTVVATVDCDEHFADDQAPTRSVALVSTGADSWSHRDLDGEAYGTPGLSPGGDHAVWVEGDDLLVWDAGSFRTAPHPDGPVQVVTVDDDGRIVAIGAGASAGSCTVEVHTGTDGGADDGEVVVPVARTDELACAEVGLALATPTTIRGDVSGQPGTEFVVRRTAPDGWALAARPPITAPGLDTYPDDPSRAVWNQVTPNTRGDLVAVGSPDRRHVTAQRYDRGRERWTRSRVVLVARTASCRRRTIDSEVLQGATFRLRLVCDGRPVALRSRTGAVWHTGR